MGTPKKILVMRFSSMGDVALVAPVLHAVAQACQEVEVTMLTRPRFAAFFYGLQRVRLMAADLEGKHKRLWGIWRLFRQLTKEKYDVVIDLHDHLRTKIIRFLFALTGTPVVVFDKGRAEKGELVRKNFKIRKKLPHTVDRYAEAFNKAGLSFAMITFPGFEISSQSEQRVLQWLAAKALVKGELWVGLAPFAVHPTKIWPLERYVPLIKMMQEGRQVKFFLFGGGAGEVAFFSGLVALFPHHTVLVAGQMSLQEELALIRKMDKMLTMDSANMHLAALLGVPVVSIWGGTHTDAGFGPYGNQDKTVLEVTTTVLPCRPCSVYGKPTCHRGDFACLTAIEVQDVAKKLMQ